MKTTEKEPSLQEKAGRLANRLSAETDLAKRGYTLIKALKQIVPKPPNAITWEQGVDILNLVQTMVWSGSHQL